MPALEYSNGSFKVNDDWIVNPNAYFSSQAGANETVFGGNLAYNVMGDGSVVVFGGAYYRWADAAVAMVGLDPTHLCSLYFMEEEGSKPAILGLKDAEISIFLQFTCHDGITYRKALDQSLLG